MRADYITAHYPAGMFRIHPRPVEKDITEFNDFAAAMDTPSGLKTRKQRISGRG